VPTFDPTWYGAISILLATVEVDIATICASIPVFWPVVQASMDKIFVTQEIKIEREHRFSAIEDDFELQRGTSGGEQYASDTVHSRATSQSSLTRNEPRVAKSGKDGHYADRYIMAQVDPLSSVGKVHSEITAQHITKKQSRGG
jgi:hypothetical protein